MKQYIKYFLLTVFCYFCSFVASAQTKSQADKLYSQDKFAEAAKIYEQLTKQGESVEVYYNLGNCYYRLDDIAHAILWYERALVLNPGDSDIRFNLRLARTKTVDKILPEEELFFVQWYQSLLNVMSASGWARTGIILFVLMLVSLAVYFFMSDIRVRKTGFYGAVLLLFLVIITNVMAWHQNNRANNRDQAILVDQSAAVKSTPAESGTDLMLLHSGTSMKIIDDSMADWYQIRLSDGKEGWIPANSLEII